MNPRRTHVPGWLRALVLKRDQGICAECGVDCCERDNRLVALAMNDPAGAFEMAKAWGATTTLPFHDGRPRFRSCWEADHVVERAHGGADELSNLRTMCLEHHRARRLSAYSAARVAEWTAMLREAP